MISRFACQLESHILVVENFGYLGQYSSSACIHVSGVY